MTDFPLRRRIRPRRSSRSGMVGRGKFVLLPTPRREIATFWRTRMSRPLEALAGRLGFTQNLLQLAKLGMLAPLRPNVAGRDVLSVASFAGGGFPPFLQRTAQSVSGFARDDSALRPRVPIDGVRFPDSSCRLRQFASPTTSRSARRRCLRIRCIPALRTLVASSRSSTGTGWRLDLSA